MAQMVTTSKYSFFEPIDNGIVKVPEFHLGSERYCYFLEISSIIIDPNRRKARMRRGKIITLTSRNVRLTVFNQSAILPTYRLPSDDQVLCTFSLEEAKYENKNSESFLLSHNITDIVLEFHQHEFVQAKDDHGYDIPHKFNHISYLADGKTLNNDTHHYEQTHDGIYGLVHGKIMAVLK